MNLLTAIVPLKTSFNPTIERERRIIDKAEIEKISKIIIY